MAAEQPVPTAVGGRDGHLGRVAEIAAKSKIPERYLHLFEDRTGLAEAPEDAYTKIYLKAYGKFLGFETSSLVEMYRREKDRTPKSMMKADTTRKHPLTTVASSPSP